MTAFPKQLAAALQGHDEGWIPTNHFRNVEGHGPYYLEQLWTCNGMAQWREIVVVKVDETGQPQPRCGEIFKLKG